MPAVINSLSLLFWMQFFLPFEAQITTQHR
jgi:hypothetical protein